MIQEYNLPEGLHPRLEWMGADFTSYNALQRRKDYYKFVSACKPAVRVTVCALGADCRPVRHSRSSACAQC